MASTSYLQLYLDTDYLLPVAVGADGTLVKYKDQQGDSRLWLYFSKVPGRDIYESGAAQKANYEASQTSSLGGFWQHLDEGDLVPDEHFPYVELLEVAGLLDTLRNWCRPVLGTPTPEVVLNFGTAIGLQSRRTLVDYLLKKGFSLRSYSVEVNELVADKVVYDHRTDMHPVFGDQMLVLHSTGEHILLSTLTWCGDCFMQGEEPTQLKKQGDDFKKTALAKMAVEKMEKQYRRLMPDEIPSEIAYQTQFADSWLKSRIGDVIWISDFHYSRNPGRIYPPEQVDGKQLDLLVEANSRETLGQIAAYCSEHFGTRHPLHTIFIGDVFRDEHFCRNCISEIEGQKLEGEGLGEKSEFFNDNALQEAMGRFFFSHGAEESEPAAELETRYLTMEAERERIRKFVKSAEKLGLLRVDIENSERAINAAIAGLKSRTADVEASWKAFMKESKFAEARERLAALSMDNALVAALNDLILTLQKKEANNSLLTDLRQLKEVHVREIVDTIEQGYKRLQQLNDNVHDLEKLPNELRERTQHYEDVYPTYLEKKKELNRETSLAGKRRVRQAIQDEDLTMEPLPIVDVETFAMNISCEVSMKGGGLFSKKKPESLTVTVQVGGGRTLPFPCVLTINGRNQVNLNREGWYADLEKGGQQWTQVIPASSIPTDEQGTCVVQIFPNEDNKHLKESIDYEKRIVKFK